MDKWLGERMGSGLQWASQLLGIAGWEHCRVGALQGGSIEDGSIAGWEHFRVGALRMGALQGGRSRTAKLERWEAQSSLTCSAWTARVASREHIAETSFLTKQVEIKRKEFNTCPCHWPPIQPLDYHIFDSDITT